MREKSKREMKGSCEVLRRMWNNEDEVMKEIQMKTNHISITCESQIIFSLIEFYCEMQITINFHFR